MPSFRKLSRQNYEPCFVNWLVDVLNNQRSPNNAYWLDEKAKIFVIRWVHRKSSAWTEECAQLFLLWKKDKSRARGSHLTPANYKSLKTNFRMNLRSKDFIELTKKYKREDFLFPVRIFKVNERKTFGFTCHYENENSYESESLDHNVENPQNEQQPWDCFGMNVTRAHSEVLETSARTTQFGKKCELDLDDGTSTIVGEMRNEQTTKQNLITCCVTFSFSTSMLCSRIDFKQFSKGYIRDSDDIIYICP